MGLVNLGKTRRCWVDGRGVVDTSDPGRVHACPTCAHGGLEGGVSPHPQRSFNFTHVFPFVVTIRQRFHVFFVDFGEDFTRFLHLIGGFNWSVDTFVVHQSTHNKRITCGARD